MHQGHCCSTLPHIGWREPLHGWCRHVSMTVRTAIRERRQAILFRVCRHAGSVVNNGLGIGVSHMQRVCDRVANKDDQRYHLYGADLPANQHHHEKGKAADDSQDEAKHEECQDRVACESEHSSPGAHCTDDDRVHGAVHDCIFSLGSHPCLGCMPCSIARHCGPAVHNLNILVPLLLVLQEWACRIILVDVQEECELSRSYLVIFGLPQVLLGYERPWKPISNFGLKVSSRKSLFPISPQINFEVLNPAACLKHHELAW
mmetsp:Transcript_140510/g.262046  ORF Transcript_140510/g.262046 Transcript_140510/m.262046 type:complete len:260 (+) Transcript_140510:325-1104(+)